MARRLAHMGSKSSPLNHVLSASLPPSSTFFPLATLVYELAKSHSVLNRLISVAESMVGLHRFQVRLLLPVDPSTLGTQPPSQSHIIYRPQRLLFSSAFLGSCLSVFHAPPCFTIFFLPTPIACLQFGCFSSHRVPTVTSLHRNL